MDFFFGFDLFGTHHVHRITHESLIMTYFQCGPLMTCVGFRVGGGVHYSYTFQCRLVGYFTSPGIDTRFRRDQRLLLSHQKDTGKRGKRNCHSSEKKSFYRSGTRTIERPVAGRLPNPLGHRSPLKRERERMGESE